MEQAGTVEEAGGAKAVAGTIVSVGAKGAGAVEVVKAGVAEAMKTGSAEVGAVEVVKAGVAETMKAGAEEAGAVVGPPDFSQS